MTRHASLINYKGIEVYYIDYSNIKTYNLFIEAIDETNNFREQLKKEGHKDLLMLVNLTGSYIYGEVLSKLKESKKQTIPLLKKSAIIGISNSKKVLLNIINTLLKFESKSFYTQEEALEWLISK